MATPPATPQSTELQPTVPQTFAALCAKEVTMGPRVKAMGMLPTYCSTDVGTRQDDSR